NVYGYEYGARVDPRRFNAGDESSDRWRSDVSDQNRRFDIDRGWRGASGWGTSGYGSTTRGQSPFTSQFGKGPKGYVRSDERIREDVCDRLSDDDEVDASDITVTVKNGEVILEGTALDRRSKHRAEDVVESISGVKDVINHLRARKGLLQEIGDKLSGQDEDEHHGHSGSGTRAATSTQRTAH
ncbi:MAG TPA: BON domain-containing protein, partial [Polyangiaceae bacterium]|nr:BON domain-containing protein [Polyangiaceae bacterium]